MRRFEFVEGSSAKFWEVEAVGKKVTVRFGRIATSGQTQVKAFDTIAAATDHRDRLIAQKVKKGYVECVVQ